MIFTPKSSLIGLAWSSVDGGVTEKQSECDGGMAQRRETSDSERGGGVMVSKSSYGVRRLLHRPLSLEGSGMRSSLYPDGC